MAASHAVLVDGLPRRMNNIRDPDVYVEPHQVEASNPDCCTECFCMTCSALLCLITFPCSLVAMFKSVQEYERAVIFRLGRIKDKRLRGPGMFTIMPCADQVRVIDLRVRSFDVPPQEVLTKDGVTVRVDAVVYYKVFNPIAAIKNVADYDKSARLLAQTALRNCLGTKTLSELLTEREAIKRMMQIDLDSTTENWGVDVERVEITDLQLPQDMRKAMAAEGEAQREARAKMIAADGEQRAARALKEAADIMNESPITLQLRYLQTLREIAGDHSSTIVFPIPVELLSFTGKLTGSPGRPMPMPITDASALQSQWKKLAALPPSNSTSVGQNR